MKPFISLTASCGLVHRGNLLQHRELLFLGEVFTWGDNDEGQLGDGSTNAIQRPRLVAALQQGKKINRVACGSAHTLAWSTNKPVATSKMPSTVSRRCSTLFWAELCRLNHY